jgi:exodeoxyribonuclease VII large subunit
MRARGIFLARRRDRLDALGQLLDAFSYRGVLERGFALVRDLQGMPLRKAAAVTPGLPIEIEFSDGRVGAVAQGAKPPLRPGSARPRRGKGGAGQGSLF